MAAPAFFGSQLKRGKKREKIKVSKQAWRTARKILKYIYPYRSTFILGMVFLVLSTITSLGFPYILGEMINSATGARQDSLLQALENIDQIALLLGGLILVQMVFSFLRIYSFSLVTQKTMSDIRYALYERLMSLPVVFFEKRRVGELTSRITADVQQLQGVLSTSLAEFFRQVLTLIGGLTAIFIISPKLTLFMLLIFPPLVIVTGIFGRFIRRHSKRTQDDLADTNVVLEESLHNIGIVKSFTNELFELSRYRGALSRVVRNSIRTDLYRGIFVSFIIFAIFGSIILVIWYGGNMVQDPINPLPIGDLFSFILFMTFVGGSLGGLPDVYSQILKAVGATERLKEILDEHPEPGIENETREDTKIIGSVEFNDVHFAYPTRPDIEVLKGVQFTISPGEKVALAGPSGAGKSTIAQLLMRFYSLETGVIKVDGKPLNEYELRYLRKQIGIVPQEVILFGGTIRENIAYGRLEATEEEIRTAAQQANCLDFIEAFTEGFETLVGDRGIKLSGGQRQRIAIARAILKDPTILLLDEATSSLDAESEKLVQDALDKLMEGRTTLIIAHRLGTIRNVDRIHVLEEGKITESGNHAELTAHNGVYNKLVQLQMQHG